MSMHFINLMYSVTPTTLRGSHTDRRQWFPTHLTRQVTDSCFECSLDAHGATVTAILKAWITFWKRLSYINLKHFNILIEDFMNANHCNLLSCGGCYTDTWENYVSSYHERFLHPLCSGWFYMVDTRHFLDPDCGIQ